MSDTDAEAKRNMQSKVNERKQQFRSMEEFLPHKNGCVCHCQIDTCLLAL